MPNKPNEGFSDEQADGASKKAENDTASGAEATRGMDGKAEGESHTHRSAYGGEGGEPKEPNDFPRSRR